MATGCLSAPQHARLPGPRRASRATGTTPGRGRTRASTSPASASASSARLVGHPVDPVIAEQAAHLTVFQRTAELHVPAHNGPLDARVEQRRARPTTPSFARERDAGRRSASPIARARAVGARGDARGAPARVRGALGAAAASRSSAPSPTCCSTREANETAAEFVREKIRDDRAATRRSPSCSCPNDHPIRLASACASTPATSRRSTATTSRSSTCATTPIDEITPTGLRTADAEYELDVHRLRHRLRRDDRRAAAHRHPRPRRRRAARGVGGRPAHLPRPQVAGLPEPVHDHRAGSPSVLSNMVVSIEQHVDWIADCIDAHARPTALARIEATAEAQDAWVAHVERGRERHALPRVQLLVPRRQHPGQAARVHAVRRRRRRRTREKCDEVAANGYEGFALDAAAVEVGG